MFLRNLRLAYEYVAMQLCKETLPNPANISLFKINNRSTRKRSDICSKLTIKIPDIEFVLVTLSLTLNYFRPSPNFPIVDFEQVNICWENYLTFYSFDICFHVSTAWRSYLTRSNAGNSVIFLISHTRWDVTLASLRLVK